MEKKDLVNRIEEFRSILKVTQRSKSLRFHINGNAVTEISEKTVKLKLGPRSRYNRLAIRALLRDSRARHLLSSNVRTDVAGSRASRSRPTSSRSQRLHTPRRDGRVRYDLRDRHSQMANGGRAWMSEGEAAHLGWVMAHPAHARRRVMRRGVLCRLKWQVPRFTCNRGGGREDSGLLALLRIYTLSARLTTCHGPCEGISNLAQKLGILDGQGGKGKEQSDTEMQKPEESVT